MNLKQCPIGRVRKEAAAYFNSIAWRDSAIAERPLWLCQLRCCQLLYEWYKSASAWGALSAINHITFYSSTCILLYTHRWNRLNYRETTMWFSCHIHVILKWAVSVVNKLWQRPTLLMTSRISPPAHRRWRGSLWWVDKFSAVRRLNWRLLDWYKKTQILVIPPAFGALVSGDPIRIFAKIFGIRKLESLDYYAALFAWSYVQLL